MNSKNTKITTTMNHTLISSIARLISIFETDSTNNLLKVTPRNSSHGLQITGSTLMINLGLNERHTPNPTVRNVKRNSLNVRINFTSTNFRPRRGRTTGVRETRMN